MRDVRDQEEKDVAFRGMCNMIAVNDQGIDKDFFSFCDAVASWPGPPSDLKKQFAKVYYIAFLRIYFFCQGTVF